MNATSTPVAHRARTNPRTPPIEARSKCSVSNCRIEPPAPGAERQAHGEFGSARRGLREREAANVGARDEQHGRDDEHKDDEWRRELLPKRGEARRSRHEPETLRNALGLLSGRRRLGHQRIENVEARDDRRRLLRAPVGAEPCHHRQPEAPCRGFRQPVFAGRHYRWLHHHRHEEICRASDFETEEFRRGHADDRKWCACERNGASDDAMIAGKPALPVVVAEHGYRMAVRTFIVLRLQRATGGGVHPEQ